ncbi:hypothetical protein Vretimale_13528 [Volvox reticuliferus]|uniref:Glycosyltransferase 2-like domain-containing protein n=1 Tax=Volvox reticuliferus TaxID=1737510 RepID=A0A8J4LUC8_9CHLO|nr:hypothetical protein Vretifemale_349 [Volvox reticuliferus]GIM09728.1 hypothetical protein Vretimale_13528 [Volvox reticuliferus]
MEPFIPLPQRFIFALILTVATTCISVLGGPDHAILNSCHDLITLLQPEQRHALRDVIQDLQAIESYLGQLQLGRPLPLSSVPAAVPSLVMLEEWKVQNTTKLHNLIDSGGVADRLGISTEAARAMAIICMSSRLRTDGYAGRPVVSIILNYFKRPQVVDRLAANMRASCASASVPCELVVNVDNPEEAGAWASEAGFVVPVFSANLHEARGYNRAARLARGKYLVVWQDDQVPPANGQWLVNMIKIFDAHPQLGVLGMNCYRLCKHHEPTNRWGWSNWAPDPVTGVKWTYAQTVDFAPMAIRASIFEAVGGLDEGSSRAGDCGIWGDWELSTRVWMDGWQVGYMFLEGRTGDGEPGTTHKGANGEKCWGRQQYVAMNVYARRYGARFLQDPMCERVWLLNTLGFKVEENGICPYDSQDTRWGNCTQPPPEVAAAAAAEFAELASAAAARGRISIRSGGSSNDHSASTAELQRLAAAADEAVIGSQGMGASGANVVDLLPPPPVATSSVATDQAGAQAGGPSGDEVVHKAEDLLGIMDINPVLVRTAGSSANRRRSVRHWL